MKRRGARKLEIQALRDEGRAAYEAGQSVHACPRQYLHTMDKGHWTDGFWAAQADAIAAEAAGLSAQSALAELIEAVREVRPLLALATDHPAGGTVAHYQATHRLDQAIHRLDETYAGVFAWCAGKQVQVVGTEQKITKAVDPELALKHLFEAAEYQLLERAVAALGTQS